MTFNTRFASFMFLLSAFLPALAQAAAPAFVGKWKLVEADAKYERFATIELKGPRAIMTIKGSHGTADTHIQGLVNGTELVFVEVFTMTYSKSEDGSDAVPGQRYVKSTATVCSDGTQMRLEYDKTSAFVPFDDKQPNMHFVPESGKAALIPDLILLRVE